MKKTLETTLAAAAILFLLWFLISWADVCCHNDPFRDDGNPHWWNSFVILTEVAR